MAAILLAVLALHPCWWAITKPSRPAGRYPDTILGAVLRPWISLGLIVILAVASSRSWPRVYVTEQPMSTHHGSAVVCGPHAPPGLAALRFKDHGLRSMPCAAIFQVQPFQFFRIDTAAAGTVVPRLRQPLGGPPLAARAPPLA